MKQQFTCVAAAALFFLQLASATAGPAPGLYEYTMKAEMPGVPADSSAQPDVRRECLTADTIGSGRFGPMPKDGNCKTRDMSESGGRFSYKYTCTGPQQIDGKVSGSATSIAFDTTISMGNRSTMKLSMTGRRIGDCRQ